MEKIKVWYFKVEHQNGKQEIVAYGDNSKFTQEQATELTKEACKQRHWKFLGIYNF